MIITVQCPACLASFPVDPNKVPEGGVRVRCSACTEIFFVDKPVFPSVADLAPEPEVLAAAQAPDAEVAETHIAESTEAPAAATETHVAESTEAPTAATETHVAETADVPAEPAHAEAVSEGEQNAVWDGDDEPAAENHEGWDGDRELAAAQDASWHSDHDEAPAADNGEPWGAGHEAPAAEHQAPPAEHAQGEAVEAAIEEQAGAWVSDDGWDSGEADPWGGDMGMLEVDAPGADYAEEGFDSGAPEVERLETVEDVTRAAAADYPSDTSLEGGNDWSDATPAAEAPVASHADPQGYAPLADAPVDVSADGGPELGHAPALDEVPAPVLSEAEGAPSGAIDAGSVTVEVAPPPVEVEVETPPAVEAAPAPAPTDAPAAEPAKFQFGRRDPHEKAKRLARVLVSDIITYNPDRHQKALEQASLHADFEDEIRKSWAEYTEQVGRELAESTPYWFDALNEILARGQKVF